jgi:hypothetical protein
MTPADTTAGPAGKIPQSGPYAGGLGGIALVWSAVIAALVTWWSGPPNALGHQRFWPGQFDIQGLVPAAYAAFAFTLGASPSA